MPKRKQEYRQEIWTYDQYSRTTIPLEVFHINWVSPLPQSGYRSYNAGLVNVERYRKPPIFLPSHKYDTAINTASLLWNRVISHTGLFKNIISDRDPKFTSAL
ncbi:hypothetical protein O181_063068 [Austropuccinia psidii MF-1]|uniref:Integrase catalytic domain-containing protein n=1 Tax=Austropuccinia psidii MF-1 TaxID=1389203 RepID=A0A9Q3EKQ0_9BASI|nr:hypothetical protein [Austropuccinia psidii MF-1]